MITSSSSTSPSFHHLMDGLQRNPVLKQRVLGTRLSSPEMMQSSQYPRVLVQQLGVLTGQLCCAFAAVPLEAQEQQEYFEVTNHHHPQQQQQQDPHVDPAIPTSMAHLLLGLIQLAFVLNIDLHWAILQKMELNNRKYPVELCKGKAGKYTAYSQVTGITKTEGQTTSVIRPTPEKQPRRSHQGSPASVMELPPLVPINIFGNADDISTSGSENSSNSNSNNSIADLMLRIRQFALDRQWQQYHQPRNLVLALMGELGELAELFQWRHDESLMQWDDVDYDDDDVDMQETEKKTTTSTTMSRLSRDKVQQEMADVAIYLLRLADVCHIGLDQCARQMVVE